MGLCEVGPKWVKLFAIPNVSMKGTLLLRGDQGWRKVQERLGVVYAGSFLGNFFALPTLWGIEG